MNDHSERVDFSTDLVPMEVGTWEGFRFIQSPARRAAGGRLPVKPRVPLEFAWLLPDGRAVLDRRPLARHKRAFLHLMTLRIHGAELRWWM